MTLPVLYADDYGLHHGDVWYRAHFTAIGSETAWLNGRFIGSSDDATHDFAFPAGSVRAGRDNVLSVMVENMGHNEDFNADDSNKQPRGLTGASLVGSSAQLTWRIQGSLGGEDLVDPTRGPMNASPGEAWYRTAFTLNLPAGQDVPIGSGSATTRRATIGR